MRPSLQSLRLAQHALPLALILFVVSCASTGEEEESESEPYTPPEATEKASGGFLLAQFDKSLRRWTELKLNPKSTRDLRTLRALEASLEKRALERQIELTTNVESGPPANRQVAVVALVERLRERRFVLLDLQYSTAATAIFCPRELPRRRRFQRPVMRRTAAGNQ